MTILDPQKPDAFADVVRSVFVSRLTERNRYEMYQGDPVAFGEEVFGESYTDDVQAVMRSVVDNPVTLVRSANATGKSHGGARIAAYFYKVFPDSQVYTAAAPPEENLKSILWGEIGKLVKTHPEVFRDDNITSLNISRGPLSFIKGVTIPTTGTPEQRESRFAGKHAAHLLFILDEGDAIPAEVYRGIESCMSGGHSRLVIFHNPRARMGPTYIMERDGQAKVLHMSAFRHPNVVTGRELIPGCVDREKTIRRINEWTRPLIEPEEPDAECFEVPDFLAGTTATAANGLNYPPLTAGWRKVENPAFFYMVLGLYPPTGSHQLIAESDINMARARYDQYVAIHGAVPPVGVRPLMGFDVASMGGDKNVVCFRYGGFVPPMIVWDGMDTDASAAKGAELYMDRQATHANIDATGVGANVAPKMARMGCQSVVGVFAGESSRKHNQFGRFRKRRDEMWWATREWLRTDPTAMLPPDEELVEELKIPTYEVKNGEIVVMSKDLMKSRLGRSPDKADALCLTHTLQMVTFDFI